MKIEEVSTINNTAFASLEVKTKARVAGVIKEIDDKETSYGTAKRFRGEIAVEIGDETVVAKTAFFPGAVRDALLESVKKIGKWDSFEFALTATKTEASWSVAFDLAPRVQQLHSLALLADNE